MKKNLLFILFGLLFVFMGSISWAQLPDGSTAPNFTATDINGNTYTLYDYLDAGKPVIMDVSATWCGPCWDYHNTHALKDLYNQYGPPGTDEVMVFFIEGDGSTTQADLEGTGTNTTGDWITGTPYPIIDSDSIGTLYEVTYFPTLYLICPDRIVTELDQVAASVLYTETQGCPELEFLAEFSANMTTITAGTTIDFTDETPLAPTSWNWTFNGGTPSSSTDQNPSVTYDTEGTYDVTLSTSNGTDTDAQTKTGYISVIPQADAFTLDFESTSDFSSVLDPWMSIDGDGEAQYNSGDYDFDNEGGSGSFMAFNPASTTPTASGDAELQPHGGSKFGACIDETTAYAPNHDWLISPKLLMGTGSAISMWVKTYKDDWGLERYNIGVSTTDPASFTIISSGSYLEAPATWTNVDFDLSNYDNQEIHIGIQCVSNDAFIFMIDDINITTTVGIADVAEKSIGIYPNPARNVINVSNAINCNVEIYNMIGDLVISQISSSNKEQLDISKLANGTYMLVIQSGNGLINKKLVINK